MPERLDFPKMYRGNIVASGVLDTDIHREFVKGQHGKKLEFDKIYKRRKSGLYLASLGLKTNMLRERVLPGQKVAILGIANGAVQHALDWAVYCKPALPGCEVVGLTTRKYMVGDQKIVKLTDEARLWLSQNTPDLVVLDDDVGTTGSSTAQPVPELQSFGVGSIWAAYDWIRSEYLQFLDQLRVPYSGIVEEPLPNYEPEECRTVGLCAQGVSLESYQP